MLGNGGAILFGLLACYIALIRVDRFDIKGWDFFLYYAVSRLVVVGQASHIYNLSAVGHMQHVLAPDYILPFGAVQNIYPPFFTVALAPFAALPYSIAYFLWLGINCFVLAACLYGVERYGGLRGRSSLVLRVAAILSLPVLVALLQGQTSILLLGLVTITFFALRSSREVLAGIALGLTLIKPQYVPAFLILLLIGRCWRALAAFLVTALTLLLVPIPVVGPGATAEYARLLLGATQWGSSKGGFNPTSNRGLFGTLQLLLPHSLSTWLAGTLALACLALVAVCARRSAMSDLPFAFATVVALFISPHVLIHDLTLLVLPIGIALRYRTTASHLSAILTWGYVAVLVGFGVAFMVPVQLSALAMAALAAWIFVACRRSTSLELGTAAHSSARTTGEGLSLRRNDRGAGLRASDAHELLS